MGLFGRKKKGIDEWLSSATYQELADEYEKRRLHWSKTGFGGNGMVTPEMKKINDEMRRRTEEAWANDPRRNKDPNYRWSDANRWDKD